jgi:hypothetical protein
LALGSGNLLHDPAGLHPREKTSVLMMTNITIMNSVTDENEFQFYLS